MIIHPEIIITPDFPTVRIRAPKEQYNLDVELPKILHSQGWGCGTYFNVQFISHDRTKLLSSALFVVSEEEESLHVNEANPYQPVTKTRINRKAEMIGEWWNCKDLKNQEMVPTGESTVKWNPGKKVHQVLLGGEVVFESPDKKLALQNAGIEIAA